MKTKETGRSRPDTESRPGNADELARAADELARGTNPLKVPYGVALEEATAAAAFVAAYWEPDGERQGLSRVAARLPRTVGDDILTTIRLVQEAQTALAMIGSPASTTHAARAATLLRTLTATLAFAIGDDAVGSVQLARVRAASKKAGRGAAAVAYRLGLYAGLAQRHVAKLREADAGFDPAAIGEAKALSTSLLEERADRASTKTTVVGGARARRNRRLALLMQQVGAVRSAAALVFRDHPEIVREVTSAYDRRRRLATKKSKKATQSRDDAA